jgi:hypothetical protein
MPEFKELSDFERLKSLNIRFADSPKPKDEKKEILNNKFFMKKLGKGNVKEGKKRFKQLLQRKLYWLDELNRVEYEVLLKCGYVQSNPRSKNKRYVVRNEQGKFDYVICLLPENESMQHMRDKEFIANLNRNISKTEWLAPDTQKRVDVMFKLVKKKIGVEIQNSSLEYSRLKEKINLLNKKFDRWFFIVPKKFVEKYSYFNTNKGEVTIMKEAINEIKEFLRKNNRNLKKAK